MDYDELLIKYNDLQALNQALQVGVGYAAQTISEQTDLLEECRKQLLESQAKIEQLESRGQDMPEAV